MSDREQLLFERALKLCANEYGMTRERMLAWLSDDEEWDPELDYPKESPTVLIDGKSPWMQVTRKSEIRLP